MFDLPSAGTGVEVGHTFRYRRARNLKKVGAINPVVSLSIAAVDCACDRIIVHAQPTVERKDNLQQTAAPHGAKIDLLLFGIRPVSADAMSITNEEANYRVVSILVDADQDAHHQ